MQNYSQTIKDHYHNPRNTGKLSDFTHTAEKLNSLCGDETRVYLKITEFSNSRGRENLRKSNPNPIITRISHETRGCMICVAAASVVSEFAKGKKLSVIKKLGARDVAKLLNVSISPAREFCAELVLKAIIKARLVKLG